MGLRFDVSGHQVSSITVKKGNKEQDRTRGAGKKLKHDGPICTTNAPTCCGSFGSIGLWIVEFHRRTSFFLLCLFERIQ